MNIYNRSHGKCTLEYFYYLSTSVALPEPLNLESTDARGIKLCEAVGWVVFSFGFGVWFFHFESFYISLEETSSGLEQYFTTVQF